MSHQPSIQHDNNGPKSLDGEKFTCGFDALLPKVTIAGGEYFDLDAALETVWVLEKAEREAGDLIHSVWNQDGPPPQVLQGVMDLLKQASTASDTLASELQNVIAKVFEQASIGQPVITRSVRIGSIVSLLDQNTSIFIDSFERLMAVNKDLTLQWEDRQPHLDGRYFLVIEFASYDYSNFDLYRNSSWAEAVECDQNGRIVDGSSKSIRICLHGSFSNAVAVIGNRDVTEFIESQERSLMSSRVYANIEKIRAHDQK